MTNIEEDKISNGIKEFEKFKALASEAIERCKKAEEEAAYFKGQNELLINQHHAAEARHQKDLLRIAELESFVATVIDSYRTWEEKLRLGHFRRATSNAQTPDRNNLDRHQTIEDRLGTAIEDELRKLQPLVAQKG